MTGSEGRATGRAAAPVAGRLAVGLAVAAVAVQVPQPLLAGEPLRTATVATVVLFAAASLTSAAATHGGRAAAALLLVAGGVGLAAEVVGVATGVPFGEYAYTGSLGGQVAGVPLLIPLAWTMMAWPALLAGRALAARAGRAWLAVPAAAWVLAAWDLFLDPQMVAAGHWGWQHPEPVLPGVPGIPLTNYAGWLLVAAVIQGLLHRAVPHGSATGVDRAGTPATAAGRGVPAALLAWTWVGSTVANAVFFGRPAVAAWGCAAMGVVVLPYLLGLRRRGPATARVRERAPARAG